MAYHVYQTKALILESAPFDEASRSFTFLTDALGIISGTAQGIRKHQSKLKYHSSLYSLVDVSVVRGREKWRVTSLREIEKASPHTYKAWARMAKIITSLTDVSRSSKTIDTDSQADIQKTFSELFLISEQFQLFVASLSGGESTAQPLIDTAEILAVYKLLLCLGYIDGSASFVHELTVQATDSNNQEAQIGLTRTHRKEMVSAINMACKELAI